MSTTTTTYAILGGTGNTGGELIKLLQNDKSAALHIYARSRPKLLEAHPTLANADPRHEIFTGALTDIDLFTSVLRGTDVVFAAVGTNNNNPDVRLAQDLALSIIGALNNLKKEASESFKPPTVVFITSVGMTSNRNVRANFGAPLHWMIQQVAGYIYADFIKATALLQRPENLWIPTIFVCAPGLIFGKSQGEVKVSDKVPKNAPIYVTYEDLAKGMLQVSSEEGKWAGKEVGVQGRKLPPLKYGYLTWLFVTGVMASWAPGLWKVGHRKGWWGSQ